MTLALDAYATEWLDLVLRTLHVIAAVAWIGSSFYFIALDLKLERPKDPADEAEGVDGEAWEIHGGGFYHVRKYRAAPPRLPERLLWFKWEAYTTWLSGFALLVVLYYLRADTYLVDSGSGALSAGAAVGVSVALLVGAWLVYDGLCRLLGPRNLLLGAVLVGLVTLAAWGSAELFAPRAAYLQVGAMLGTMMAGNVLFCIIPAHWELVRAKRAGRGCDPAPGIRAKQRSLHNNYLTLPVLFAMLAGHLPSTYGSDHAWLVLVALMVVGAWTRHFFNLRHAGRTVWWIPVTAAGALAAIAAGIRPEGEGGGAGAAKPVSLAAVQQVVARRCQPCHSTAPTLAAAAPAGVRFDTPGQIRARIGQIRALAVDSRAMPPGNVTRMSDAERALLARWIRSTR